MRTPRSCLPTTARARAWTARRSRCPATRTSSSTPWPRQPQDDRRAQHGRPRAMPWPNHVEAVLAGLVPGPAVRRRPRLRALRRQRSRRPAAVTFPAGDAQGPAPPTRPDATRAQRRAALRRGDLRRLPLVRPVPPAAAVPLRLRTVIRRLPLRRPPPALRPRRRDCIHARDQHEPPRGLDRRAGLSVLPALDGRAAAPAQGLREGELGPRQSAVVSFRLDRDDLSYYDERAHRRVVAGGRYALFVGSSSRDLPVRRGFELGGHGHR